MHQIGLYPPSSFHVVSLTSRLTSSRPDAKPITPYHAKPISSSPSSSCSHHVLRSRHSNSQRTSAATRGTYT
eukprot:1153664-Pelagomonas_calceolata.AAC.1